MPTLPARLDRIGAAWKAAYMKLEAWKLKWPLLGITVVLVIEEVWIGLLRERVWPVVRSFLVHFASLPVGWAAGLVLLASAGWALVLTTSAFLETSPARRMKPPHLTPDEKDTISRIRKLWYDKGGQRSVFSMLGILGQVESALAGRHYLRLYNSDHASLHSAAANLETTLDLKRLERPERVIGAFNDMFAAYLRVSELLYDTFRAETGLEVGREPFASHYKAFMDAHKDFSDDLALATNYHGVNGELRVFAFPGMELSSRKFLGEQPWDGAPPRLGDEGKRVEFKLGKRGRGETT